MARGRGRGRRGWALLAGVWVAGAVLATLPSMATAMPARTGGPTQQCGLLNPCETTASTSDPVSGETTTSSTSPDESSSTTIEDTTTTTAELRQTTTTRRGTTATTAEEVVETTTTLSVTTSSNVLVPGDGTKGAESTTTTIERATTVSDSGPSDGTLIGLVIAGLVLIAIVVSVLLWRYWAATRPPLRDPSDVGPSPAG